jgi:hypothetical protein
MLKRLVVASILILSLNACAGSSDLRKFQAFVSAADLKGLKTGSVPLPADQKSLTADGNIYVDKAHHASVIIIFDTWVGKGANMEGYLYSSKPLTNADLTKDYYGEAVIELFGIQYVITKTADPHWYAVEFHLS